MRLQASLLASIAALAASKNLSAAESINTLASHVTVPLPNISLAVLELTSLDNKVSTSMYVSPSLFGPPLPAAVTSTSYLSFALANPLTACTPLLSSVQDEAVLIDRGDCSFETKVLHAQAAGAALVLVRDTPTAALKQPNQVDCSLGAGDFCEESASCVSSTCVFSPLHQERCCVRNILIAMNGSTAAISTVTIPSVYLTVLDGATIENFFVEHPNATFVTVSLPQDESPWNWSMLLIWALGVAIVVASAYYSAAKERQFSQHLHASTLHHLSDPHHDPPSASSAALSPFHHAYSPIRDAQEEPLNMTLQHALLFLVMGSCMLLLMYYVHVILFVQCLFALASWVCITHLITYPLLAHLMPHRPPHGVGCNWPAFWSVWPSLALVLWWFLARHDPLVWILQNFLGICLCFVFVDSIHIQSLRIATILLGVAFAYDVFFVYFSPLVFGSNVMVEVASQGGKVSLDLNAFCVRHPESATCGHDTIPLVLSIPLILSTYGGNSLLGLGDIVLPALLVSFALRVDYCHVRPLNNGSSYFVWACVAYAVGLLMANVMAIVLQHFVAGQPALMYIVPCMLGAVLTLARSKGADEFQEMWDGPACLALDA
ncbi:hypothetical protein H310_12259 [Aphanomyces invadans]|uniref:PA domain-containing protein n=1 Tax=Aphanomyces invadans TaxID=157072 RepID=A0A024TIG2_9STRA|nr:hypothetical protein H310_12259 [Aphanomyces invadans]ETV93915.1 hypothetical protein H310_12259 [Aphanomyces invadans]|eukprot:XP_008877475.1 hypothetical protein H310_12259 [Aphanomyces invadans]